MLLDHLTKVINTVTIGIEPIDIKVTVGCMLYSQLIDEKGLDLRKKALSFKDYYVSMANDKKYNNRSIGYRQIEKIIRNKKINSLDNVSAFDYNEIVGNFLDDELDLDFDPTYVDSRMFGIRRFESVREKRLYEELHNDILKPISLYYNKRYDIPYGNLKIVEVADTVVPAREITFYIKDYPTDRVNQDIIRKLIFFKKYPSLVKITRDGLMRIII